jgi:hypothetical protein
MFIAPLALMAALNGAPASTAYSNQPVQIADCSVSQSASLANQPGFAAPYGANLSISFVNTSPKTVESVTFGVNDGRSTSRIVDAGTFSSNVRIEHEFVTPQLIGNPDVACTVQSVAFSDGTTWQAQ